ncbi:MAG: YchJ family metal-binding protein [Kofleriaceae bacterium]
MTTCACGSGDDASACCRLYLDGLPAPTALALMRSRYSAYVEGAIDYLLETHDVSTRANVDRPGITAWSRDTEWLGLEILACERGGPGDDDGIVEFIARGSTQGAAFAQRERSRFRKLDGRWFYIDGKTGQLPARATAVAGRNDPCPCGSGKKYKRCHGA